MNKLLEILQDVVENERDDFNDEEVIVNCKDIHEICGGEWIVLRDKPYWMQRDVILEDNDRVEARILPWELNTALRIGDQLTNLPKTILGPPQNWKPGQLEKHTQWTTRGNLYDNWASRVLEWEEFLPYRNKWSWIRDTLNKDGYVKKYDHNPLEIHMYFQHPDDVGYNIKNWYDDDPRGPHYRGWGDDEAIAKAKQKYLVTYNADFIIQNGNHRVAIMSYDNLDIDVPVRLYGKRYDKAKDHEYLNNEIYRRPLSFRIKSKKATPPSDGRPMISLITDKTIRPT